MYISSRTLMIGIISFLTTVATTPVFAHSDEHQDAKNDLASEQTEFGQPGEAKNITRTIDVSMGDAMRFVPDSMQIKQGETVRLQFTNTGNSPHEFVLGTPAEIAEHAEQMRKFPDMQHADASSVRVEAGKTATIIWQFNRGGEFVYACLIPGHWEAGMKGNVTVTASQTEKVNDKKEPASVVNPSAASPAGELTEGVIRKIDLTQSKLTIKHGEIKNLDMPSMTMIFRFQDTSMLKTVKQGDAIFFRAEKINGALTVTKIEVKK